MFWNYHQPQKRPGLLWQNPTDMIGTYLCKRNDEQGRRTEYIFRGAKLQIWVQNNRKITILAIFWRAGRAVTPSQVFLTISLLKTNFWMICRAEIVLRSFCVQGHSNMLKCLKMQFSFVLRKNVLLHLERLKISLSTWKRWDIRKWRINALNVWSANIWAHLVLKKCQFVAVLVFTRHTTTGKTVSWKIATLESSFKTVSFGDWKFRLCSGENEIRRKSYIFINFRTREDKASKRSSDRPNFLLLRLFKQLDLFFALPP